MMKMIDAVNPVDEEKTLRCWTMRCPSFEYLGNVVDEACEKYLAQTGLVRGTSVHSETWYPSIVDVIQEVDG